MEHVLKHLTPFLLSGQQCQSTENTDLHPFNGLFFQDNLGKPAPQRLNQSGF